MDTINTAAVPATGIIPLGTMRRNNRNLYLRHDTDETNGIRFKFAVGSGDERTELGAVTIRSNGRPERQWLPAAKDFGITKGHIVEAGIIKALRGLARSIAEEKALSSAHGFVKDPQCPHPFEVEDLVAWGA